LYSAIVTNRSTLASRGNIAKCIIHYVQQTIRHRIPSKGHGKSFAKGEQNLGDICQYSEAYIQPSLFALPQEDKWASKCTLTNGSCSIRFVHIMKDIWNIQEKSNYRACDYRGFSIHTKQENETK